MQINPASSPLPSLRSRLLLAAAVWLLGITAAASYVVPTFIKSYLVDQEKEQLYLYMDELTAMVDVDSTRNVIPPKRLSNPRFQQPYSGLYWSLSINGLELRSRSLWDTRIQGDEENGYTGPNQQSLLVVKRQFFLPEKEEPVDVVIAANQEPLLHTLKQLTNGLWMILTVMVIGILILIWFQVSWSLLPLRRLQQKLKQVRDGEASELSGRYPAEIRPVVDDLNALLFHYQEVLERARNHAGNLSHALKTPIAVLHNEVGKLPPEEKARLQPTLAQLQQHIDYHLGRARMAGAANILAAKTAPSLRVDAISMAMDKVYVERDLILVNELDSDLMVAVEKRDLDEILGNLIENSYKWATSLIRVHQLPPTPGTKTTESDRDTVTIVIDDDGPGIDAQACQDAMKRGVRLDETTPGTGLGLSIVAELTHTYRGRLGLDKSPLGGLRATVQLPKPRN
ncbi:ATP-binding protein [Photobacterium sp. GSS17]|uniref:ATP-binding protein n=1 Tax=Photobacterium sp. GSS17 TaxID=3020715 RepID=UPI00235F46AF|nr:ATP-binding protein [Photobacterium sp. GSS17]